MLSRRYSNDGKEFLRLNDIQKKAKREYLDKISGGVYCYIEYRCECGAGFSDMELIAEKDRYGLPVQTRICKKCGLIMTNPTLDQDSLNEFYDSEYRKLYVGVNIPKEDFFLDQYEHGKKILNFLKSEIDLDRIHNVLEIGTGAGGILKAFKDSADMEVTGTDLGSEYIEFGKRHGIDLYQMNSCALAERFPHKYDLIILSHVLEHFLDIKQELNAIKKLLTENGVLYIEVPGIKDIPNSYVDFMGFLQNAHIRHFTLDTLTQVLRWSGFEIIAGNERIQSVFTVKDVTWRKDNFYKDNISFLKGNERKNFCLIHIRYPLARIPLFHRIYEILTGKGR